MDTEHSHCYIHLLLYSIEGLQIWRGQLTEQDIIFPEKSWQYVLEILNVTEFSGASVKRDTSSQSGAHFHILLCSRRLAPHEKSLSVIQSEINIDCIRFAEVSADLFFFLGKKILSDCFHLASLWKLKNNGLNYIFYLLYVVCYSISM